MSPKPFQPSGDPRFFFFPQLKEFPSKRTSHGSGGPQDGPLNSTPCLRLEPGLPKEPQSQAGLLPFRMARSLLPSPGEPRGVTFERAAQAGFSKMR